MVNEKLSVPYSPIEGLNSPEDVAAYLEAAMEDEDEQVLLMALRNAVASIVLVASPQSTDER